MNNLIYVFLSSVIATSTMAITCTFPSHDSGPYPGKTPWMALRVESDANKISVALNDFIAFPNYYPSASPTDQRLFQLFPLARYQTVAYVFLDFLRTDCNQDSHHPEVVNCGPANSPVQISTLEQRYGSTDVRAQFVSERSNTPEGISLKYTLSLFNAEASGNSLPGTSETSTAAIFEADCQ